MFGTGDRWQAAALERLGWASRAELEALLAQGRQRADLDLCGHLVALGRLEAAAAEQARELARRDSQSSSGSSSGSGEAAWLARPRDLARALAEGQRIAVDGYTLVRPLGEGGMGVVYEARSPSGEPCALKTLRLEGLSETARERFAIEGQVLQRLSHPHILPVLAVGEAPVPYLVLPLAAGSLADRLRDEGPLPAREVLSIGAGIARALDHAHRRGVVHRDLKPANLLVDGEGRALVADFGLAKDVEPGAASKGLSLSGQIVGTLAYMAPEQIERRPGGITGQVDIYGLGATLFELLTGEPPFNADSEVELIAAVFNRPPPRADALTPGAPRELATILERAMAKRPEQRFESAAALAEDLERALRGETIAARGLSQAERVRLWMGRHRRIQGALWSGLVLAPAAAVAISGAFAWAQSQVRARAEASQQQAERAEAQARRRFERARALARAMIFEVEEAISRLPGATRARRLLVERSIRYLEALAADELADASLRLEIAEALLKVAWILGGNLDSLGETARAEALIASSQELVLSVRAEVPDDPEALRVEAWVHLRRSQVLKELGRYDEAAREIQAGLSALDAIPAGAILDAARATLEFDLRYSEVRRLHDLRRNQAALDAIEELEGWASERVERLDPVSYAALANLEGILAAGQSLNIRSKASHERALERLRPVLARHPEDTIAWRNWASSASALARIYREAGDSARALRSAREAAEAYESLLRFDPDNIQLMRHAASVAFFYGVQLCAERDPRAREVIERGLALRQAMAARDPSTQSRLALAQFQTGVSSVLRGGAPGSADFERARELARAARDTIAEVSQSVEPSSLRREQTEAAGLLAELELSANNLSPAEAYAREAAQTAQTWADEGGPPLARAWFVKLSVIRAAIAARQRDLSGAATLLAEAREVYDTQLAQTEGAALLDAGASLQAAEAQLRALGQ